MMLRPALVFVLTMAAVSSRAQPAAFARVLESVGTYVQQFEKDFAVVLSDEEYVQTDVVSQFSWSSDAPAERAIRKRSTRSEMLFTWLPDDQVWLTVRNVLVVDGKPVADSGDRVSAVLREPPSSWFAHLQRLRDEGARFNLGRIQRNFSDPALVLQLLDPAFQARFVFWAAGTQKVNGVETWKIGLAERARPTVIQNDGEDLPLTGFAWIARPDSAVIRTSLTLSHLATNTKAETVVDYRRDTKLRLWVPARMTEVYVQGPTPSDRTASEERIQCVATYSNFRRFETSGRVILPQ